MGIGTGLPGQKFVVSGTSPTFGQFADASTSYGLFLTGNSGGAGGSGFIGNTKLNSNSLASSVSAGTTADGILFKDGTIFYSDVTGGGTYTPTERMRLTNTGNFGIGTSTPLVLLSVQNISTTTKDILDIASSSGASFLRSPLWGMWGLGWRHQATLLM